MEPNPSEVVTQEVSPVTPSPVVNPDDKSHTSHKVLFILLGIIILLILIGGIEGGYYLGRRSVIKELNPSSPTIPPKDPEEYKGSFNSEANFKKLSSLFSKYQDYSVKNDNVYYNEKQLNNTARFSDKKMGITFLYPKNFYFKSGSVPVTENTTSSDLLIAMSDDLSDKDSIDYDIDCRIDPNPGGLCRESLTSWLDISISSYYFAKEFDDLANLILSQKGTALENIGKFEGIAGYTSDLDGSQANSYSFLLRQYNKNYESLIININSKTNISESENYSYALWLLVNSFQIE